MKSGGIRPTELSRAEQPPLRKLRVNNEPAVDRLGAGILANDRQAWWPDTTSGSPGHYNPHSGDWHERAHAWGTEPGTGIWTRNPDTGRWSRDEEDPRAQAWRREASARR